ncbi:MAG: MFS transporter [Dehalococcoidia bacterium]
MSSSEAEARGVPAGGVAARESAQAGAAAVPAVSRGGMLRSLRHRDFRLFWLGLVMALTGFQVQRVGLAFLAYDLTGSALYLTLVFLGDSLPMVLLSPIGGVIGDRLNRKLVLMVTRTTIAIAAVMVCLLTVSGLVQAWQLLIFALVTGLCYAFDLPTRQAMVRDLVPERDFVNAVALTSSAMQGSRIIGPAVGGAILALGGPGGAFAVMAAGQVGQVLMVMLLNLPHVRRAQAQSVLANLVEGARFIAGRESIWVLFLISMIPALFAMNYMSLTPVFALDVLGRGEASIGIMYAVAGIGALTGSILIAAHGERLARPSVSALAAVAFSLLVIVFAVSRLYPVSLVLLVLVGASGSIYSVGTNSAVQAQTPREMQGRVMGVYQMTWNAQFFGALGVGAAADVVGAPGALAIAGAISAAAIGVVILLRPRIRSM